jgi:hypothetical protein
MYQHLFIVVNLFFVCLFLRAIRIKYILQANVLG